MVAVEVITYTPMSAGAVIVIEKIRVAFSCVSQAGCGIDKSSFVKVNE
jgi:hypothetical protein